MTINDNRKLEIFIFGVALLSILLSLTTTNSFDIKLDDLPLNDYQSQTRPVWQSEIVLSAATGTRVYSERSATLTGRPINA